MTDETIEEFLLDLIQEIDSNIYHGFKYLESEDAEDDMNELIYRVRKFIKPLQDHKTRIRKRKLQYVF